MNLFTGFSSKIYVWSILGTLLFLLIIGEFIVRCFIVPIPNTTPYRVDQIYTETKTDIAIGDSHIYRAFLKNNNFLNLGRGGTTIPMMKIIVEQYFKHREPGKVIIEASPQFFSKKHLKRGTENYEEFFNQNNFFPIKAYIFEPGIGRWLKGIESFKDFSRLVKEREQALKHLTLKGSWINVSAKKRVQRIKKRINGQRPKIENATPLVNIYKELITYLISRGAKVCMLRTPVDETYLENIKDDIQFSKALQLFKMIAEDMNIQFVDFQELDYEYTLDKFINQDHLTPDAGVEFSRLVNTYCFGNQKRDE